MHADQILIKLFGCARPRNPPCECGLSPSGYMVNGASICERFRMASSSSSQSCELPSIGQAWSKLAYRPDTVRDFSPSQSSASIATGHSSICARAHRSATSAWLPPNLAAASRTASTAFS